MRRCILFGLVLALVSNASASAAIIVSYSGGTVSAGGTGFVDVLISSDAAPGTPDNLDLFQLQFRISPVGTGTLEFTNPQSESHLGMSQYVLNGDSFGFANSPISTVSDFAGINDQLDSLDATQSFNGVDLTNLTGQKLLFRLDLNAVNAADGEQFEIALIDGLSQFSDLNGGLYVATPLPTGGSLELHNASFNPFIVTATAAVPEPSTTAILLIGSACFSARCRRRRETSETTPQDS